MDFLPFDTYHNMRMESGTPQIKLPDEMLKSGIDHTSIPHEAAAAAGTLKKFLSVHVYMQLGLKSAASCLKCYWPKCKLVPRANPGMYKVYLKNTGPPLMGEVRQSP
jgi:hypothetical protein